jgi:hypothetical protein
MTLLNDAEWGKRSDNEIGRRAGVDNSFVSKLRKEVTIDEQQSERTYTTKHGTTATMSVANIGRTVAPAIMPSSEPAPIPNAAPEADKVGSQRGGKERHAQGAPHSEPP